MKKISYLIGLAAISLSACATTNAGFEAPMAVQPSTLNLNIQKSVQITEPDTTLIENPLVLDLAKLNKSFSFQGPNEALGSLGPKTNYELFETTELIEYRTKDISRNIYCRLNKNSTYVPCLIDTNKDGSFNKTALRDNVKVFLERDLDESISYEIVNNEIDCNLNITISRTLFNRHRLDAALDGRPACPGINSISNLKSVNVTKEELPKEYSIVGSRILIHSIDEKKVTYTVKQPISSGLALSKF